LPGRPFKPGERVLLIDGRDRRYLLTLQPGVQFHSHHGFVGHDEVLGQPEGRVVRMQDGARYLCVRPTLADVVLKMPRGAQVIYPKDLGPILLLADIFPGARVLESGVGSGALSMTLLRAGADITGYEIREDFAARARENVAAFVGADVVAERYDVRIRDVYEGIEETGFDRMVLDLPEPWNVVRHAEHALAPGGILVSYLPSIIQVQHLRAALDHSGFGMCETQEVLVRTWKVEGNAVRPDHRMVAHTGFLTSARLLEPPGGDDEVAAG
jgi:tRNA (adenine57-N1/adenine58-N1)-methyltransferase